MFGRGSEVNTAIGPVPTMPPPKAVDKLAAMEAIIKELCHYIDESTDSGYLRTSRMYNSLEGMEFVARHRTLFINALRSYNGNR